MSRGTVRMSIPSEILRVGLVSRFMTGICVVLAGLTACGHLQVGLAWQHWLLGWGVWAFIIPNAIWSWQERLQGGNRGEKA